jgi:hypothetical protein
MAGQSTLRHGQHASNLQTKKQAWLPSIPFFNDEDKTTEDDELRPGIEDDDNHYTLTIRQFEYSSSGKDPERWCSWRMAMDGLFNSLGVHEDSPEERKNLFYSNLGPLAQSDWQRMTEKRFAPEVMATPYPDEDENKGNNSEISEDDGKDAGSPEQPRVEEQEKAQEKRQGPLLERKSEGEPR